MFRARRRISLRLRLTPPLVFMGTCALLSIAAVQLTAAAPFKHAAPAAAADAVACPTSAGVARAAAARHTTGISTAVDAVLDAGVYTGQTLTISGAGRSTSLGLPAESFVGQQTTDALVYTRFINGKSEVHVLDAATGCDTVVARPAGIVRSAILDPSATTVYVHAISNPARTDLGVMRYTLDGSAGTQAVPPLPDDPAFGLTFGTQLGWSTDGTALFVQSCGAAQCRTRVLDVASNAVSTYNDAGQGSIVGMTREHLVTFAACDGSPCPVISIDRTSGVPTVLAQQAISASIDDTASGTAEATITTPAGTTEVDQ